MRGLSLFARVYLFAVAPLVVVGAALAAVIVWRVVPGVEASVVPALRWLGRDFVADCDDPARLVRRKAALEATTPMRLEVRCGEDSRFGAATPLPAGVLGTLASSGEARLENPDAFVVGDARQHAVIRLGGGIFIGLLWVVGPLAVLALLAWPAARSLGRPLRQLETDVERFGSGDLSARSAVRRGDEIGALSRAFNRMAAQIEAQSRAQRLLMAGISHELRTPLQRMTSALALGGAEDPVKGLEIRDTIRADIRQLSALLDDVLLLTRLEHEATWERLIRRTPTSVAALIDDAVSEARFEVPEARLRVDVAADAATRMVSVDARLAPRAVRNLVDNALAHGADSCVRLTARLGVAGLCIDVVDEGPGVPATAREEVFLPFGQVGFRRTGVGLGLTLARAIAVAHGGALTLNDRPDGTRGAHFTLTLPLSSE